MKNRDRMQSYPGSDLSAPGAGVEPHVARILLVSHQRILQDPRHRNVRTLIEEPVAERSFTNWSTTTSQCAVSRPPHKPCHQALKPVWLLLRWGWSWRWRLARPCC